MNSIRMSSKGQLVVPQRIRDREGFEPGDEFVAVPVEGGVVFKRRLSRKEASDELRKVFGEVQDSVKKLGISRATVDEAVEWVRKRS